MIPETTSRMGTMTHFDQELRDGSEWKDWEEREKYAIEYEGRRYPVKAIVSMATNLWVEPPTTARRARFSRARAREGRS